MRIPDVIQMNDWGISKFVRTMLLFQAAFIFSFFWTESAVDVPVVHQVISILYLSFVPGMLILRVLRMHRLGAPLTLVYTIGLSISALMIVGVIANSALPAIGVSNPVSAFPMTVTVSIVVLVLCFVSYLRDRDYDYPCYIEIGPRHTLLLFFLLSIVILAIAGALLVNSYNDSLAVMISLLLITLTITFVGFRNTVPASAYPAVVLAISVALLFHASLISKHLCWFDIQFEAYTSNTVIADSSWKFSTSNPLNGMLSLTILGPILSAISGIDTTWIFKVVYPAFFALVPLALYLVWRDQIKNEKLGLLSVLFFMSVYTFYDEMVTLARQEIAEIFFVLIILLLVDKKLDSSRRSFLLLLFGISIVVSHYGITYVLILILACTWLVIRSPRLGVPTFSGKYVVFLAIVAFSWYTYSASASLLDVTVANLNRIASNFFEDFFSPSSSQGLALLARKGPSWIYPVAKYMHLIAQGLIVIGVVYSISRRKKSSFQRVYLVLSGVSLGVMFAGIAVPFLGSALNVSRLYHIGLFFLAPFLVIGCSASFSVFRRFFSLSLTIDAVREWSVRVMAVFIAAFLLFNSGFVLELAGTNAPKSMYMDSTVDAPRFSDQEVIGAAWLVSEKGAGNIYGDSYRWVLLASMDWPDAGRLPLDPNRIPGGSYIYVGSLNIQMGKVLLPNTTGTIIEFKYFDVSYLLQERSKIMDEGGAAVYH